MTNILAFQFPAGHAPAVAADGAAARWIAAGEGLARALSATGSAVRGFARTMTQAREAEARYRALAHLSDGALADIGLTRADIGRIVAGSFGTPTKAVPAAAPAPRPAEELPLAA